MFKNTHRLHKPNTNATKESKNRIPLPYIKGISEKLARILKRGDIEVAFSPINTIKEMLDSAKDPVDPLMYNGFYEFLVLVVNST